MPVTRIAHACIRTADLDATEAFWCQALGAQKQFDFMKAGARIGFYLNLGGGCYMEFFRRGPQEAAPDGPGAYVHLCLETDDIQQLRRDVLAFGAEATEPKLGCDGSWQFWTQDPNGARLEFHQYTADSAQRTGRPVEVNW